MDQTELQLVTNDRSRVRHLYSDTMHVQTLILRKQAVIKNFFAPSDQNLMCYYECMQKKN